MTLRIGRAYYLEGMERPMWDGPHPVYGAPTKLAGFYLGSLQGRRRRWHGFEVWIENQDAGVIFMNDDDLGKLKVTPLNDIAKG